MNPTHTRCCCWTSAGKAALPPAAPALLGRAGAPPLASPAAAAACPPSRAAALSSCAAVSCPDRLSYSTQRLAPPPPVCCRRCRRRRDERTSLHANSPERVCMRWFAGVERAGGSACERATTYCSDATSVAHRSRISPNRIPTHPPTGTAGWPARCSRGAGWCCTPAAGSSAARGWLRRRQGVDGNMLVEHHRWPTCIAIWLAGWLAGWPTGHRPPVCGNR
jgi:hypothetical protein